VRREGSFFGMQSFVSKLGGALGLAVVGGVLSLIGFVPGAAQQAEPTLDWIRILFSWFRAAGYSVAFLLLLAYPLTEARVHAIRTALDARGSKAGLA
jgi:Na+/melibiose symporter-like transporter